MNPLQLLQRCEAGEAAAIEEFVRTYQPTAYRLAISILNDPAEADEAAQDAVVTALDQLASFRGEATFTTWLYALTLNLCRGRLRKRRTRQRLGHLLQEVFHISDQTQHPEAEVQRLEADATLWSAVQRLADPQREVIVLRYYHNLPTCPQPGDARPLGFPPSLEHIQPRGSAALERDKNETSSC